MLNKLFTLFVGVFIFSSMAFGQAVVFSDDFDSYTAGLQLACQNPTDWTTWSSSPCNATEDPYVSSNYALSGANSVVIVQNNDCVHLLGTQTSGKWEIRFNIYIPTGKWGYFNTLAIAPQTGTTNWAMQVYLEAAGAARMDAGGASSATWTYAYDTWQEVVLIVDLDTDVAEFWFAGTMIYSWQWTLGTFGAGSPLQLDGNNFFGATADDEMYVDNYTFTDMLASAGFSDDFESYTAGVQLTTQTTEWRTWSGTPGTGEDPYVSDTYAFSGSNSVVIVSGNDLVRMHGPKTSGKWYMSFLFYIPQGNSGYFNTMNAFSPDPFTWGMDCFFNVGGDGLVDTTGGGGGPNSVAFTWTEAHWNQAIVVVDLDATPPTAELWVGTSDPLTMVATWDWTQGGTKPAALAVNDFFGGATTDEMYMDDYYFGDTPPAIIPVELTSFVANVSIDGSVVLNWTTATELNNQMFEIERRSEQGEFFRIGYVNGHGTTTEAQEYTYVDNSVEVGTYSYRLKQIDFNGTYKYSDAVEIEVNGPLTYNLEQNYPNPFNPSTNIRYSVLETGLVKLSVYNLIGEEVSVLVNDIIEAGFHEATFDASSLPSGTYFYRLQAGNTVLLKKMILMK